VEVWVQESMFEGESGLSRSARKPGTAINGTTRGRRNDWSRVTRDPAVATSYSETTKVAVDFRLGLAQALAQLSPDQRRDLRATIERPAKRRAA
jgi:hypothetical protein